MEKQVLTIEQMRELIDMGIDISKASAYFDNAKCLCFANQPYENNKKQWIEVINEYYQKKEWIPTFTLQDILTLLEPYYRLMVIRHESSEWMDSAFKLLKFQYKDRNN